MKEHSKNQVYISSTSIPTDTPRSLATLSFLRLASAGTTGIEAAFARRIAAAFSAACALSAWQYDMRITVYQLRT